MTYSMLEDAMKSEQWTRNELRKLEQTLKQNAREDEKEARESVSYDDDRAKFLEGCADASKFAASQIKRILQGKSEAEALIKALRNTRS